MALIRRGFRLQRQPLATGCPMKSAAREAEREGEGMGRQREELEKGERSVACLRE